MRNMMTVVTCAAFVALSARTVTQSKAEAPAARQAFKGSRPDGVAGIKVGHYTLTERPTGCTVILANRHDWRRGRARRRAGHARDGSARPGQRRPDRQRHLARRAAAPTASTPHGRDAVPRRAQDRLSGRPMRRADRAGGHPLRSRIRRRREDPSDGRLRLQSGHRRERRPGGGRQRRRGRRRDRRQDGRAEAIR